MEFEILIILLITLTAAYWLGALFLIIFGLAKIKSPDEEKRKKHKTYLIIGVIMLVIGFGFCGGGLISK